MYGSKGTIGLIVPSPNTVVEREVNTLLPAEYGVVAARMWNTHADPEHLATMPDDAVVAAQSLATAGVSIIAFACTSGSFVGGVSGESTLRTKLEATTEGQVVTTSDALVEALRYFSIKNVALVTPYTDELNSREGKFLSEKGIRVVSSRGMGIVESIKIGHCDPKRVRDLVLEADVNEADGVLISCTNLRSIEIIPALEQALGKPVISSNQATLWDCLRRMGHTEPLIQGGRLLEGFA